MSALKKIVNGIDKVFTFIERYFTAIPLIVFTVLIFANVIGRYVFLHSITWAEELSRYLNIMMVFIAISAGIKTGAHIGVDAVVNLVIPKKLKKTHKTLRVVKFIIIFVFCAITCVLGISLSGKVQAMNQLSTALRIPMYLPYMLVPIGMFMAAVRSLMQIIKEFIDPPQDDLTEAERSAQEALQDYAGEGALTNGNG